MLETIEAFFKDNNSNVKIIEPGKISKKDLLFEREALTRALWEVSGYIMDFARIYSKEKKNSRVFNIVFNELNLRRSEDGIIEFFVKSVRFSFYEFSDLGLYLRGKWFEEYVVLQLLPLIEDGLIKDLRYSMRVDQKINKEMKFLKEIDVAFLNGKYFYLIECKTGKAIHLSGAQESKITNLAKSIGNDVAIPILVTPNTIDSHESYFMAISGINFASQIKLFIKSKFIREEDGDA